MHGLVFDMFCPPRRMELDLPSHESLDVGTRSSTCWLELGWHGDVIERPRAFQVMAGKAGVEFVVARLCTAGLRRSPSGPREAEPPETRGRRRAQR